MLQVDEVLFCTADSQRHSYMSHIIKHINKANIYHDVNLQSGIPVAEAVLSSGDSF